MMKQFLKYLFASTLGTIVGLVLIVFLSGLILAGIVGSAIMAGKSSKEVNVKANSVMVIDLTKGIVEHLNNPCCFPISA